MELWNKQTEVEFFSKSKAFSNPEKLFYRSDNGRLFAFWPKGYDGKKTTLQSRNALIGSFTEKWTADILKEFASKKGYHIVQSVVCEEFGLTNRSPADLAICKSLSSIQRPENIKAIFEIKMSVVWNWEYKNNELICLGDFTTHSGTPGILRSDSMLKAIGKSINIRVSDYRASKIPIIILGNTPITDMYKDKVDHLKQSGIVQGFWSLNPDPRDGKITLDKTAGEGFSKIESYEILMEKLEKLFSEECEFFSSMKSHTELGRLIEIANRETSYDAKAKKFLELIRK